MRQINVGDAIEKAKQFIESGKNLEQALSILNQTLNGALQHPEIRKHEVLFLLGSLHKKLNYYASAIVYYEAALKIFPDFIEAHNNIGCIYKSEGFKALAERSFKEVLRLMDVMDKELKPEDKSQFLTNYATVKILNGTPKEALELLNKAIKYTNDKKEILWNRSLAYLEMGDYKRGFLEFEYGARLDRERERSYSENGTPFWDGTKGQTVVVFGEQGIGDELMFASMIPDLIKDCKCVIIDAHLRLQDIFRESFPGIIVYGSREQTKIPWGKYHKIDAKIAMGSLGKFYRKSEAHFPKTPYLKADPILIEKYRLKLSAMGNRPKIGISWKGGVKATSRTMPLDLIKDLIVGIDADFISLQYNPDAITFVKEFEQKNNISLNHWVDTLDDYDETAGLVSNLDLVISVPQSVVHLAGSLGVPTWQLCPKQAMWQVGPFGKDMPWYGCVHNIWQEKADDWKPVLTIAREKLCNLLATSIES